MRLKNFLRQLKYGNTVYIEANKKGKENLKAAMKAAKFSHSLLRKKFYKQGYLSLGLVFPTDLVEKLQKEFCDAIHHDDHSSSPFDDPVVYDGYNYGGYQGKVDTFRRDIKDCSKSIPSVSEIWSDEFTNLFKEVLGANFEQESAAAWRNYHVPEDIYKKFEVTTNRFHFDSQYVDTVKIFIYLNDVTLKEGPFQHFSRRYSRYLLLKGFKEEERKNSVTSGLPHKIINSPHLIRHTGPAGHVVLCATSYCIHRAGEVTLGHHRDLLQLVVRPKI